MKQLYLVIFLGLIKRAWWHNRLVVWSIFYFPITHILGIIIPTDKYFSGVETTNQIITWCYNRVIWCGIINLESLFYEYGTSLIWQRQLTWWYPVWVKIRFRWSSLQFTADLLQVLNCGSRLWYTLTNHFVTCMIMYDSLMTLSNRMPIRLPHNSNCLLSTFMV